MLCFLVYSEAQSLAQMISLGLLYMDDLIVTTDGVGGSGAESVCRFAQERLWMLLDV